MASTTTINSDSTGLRIAEETSIGVLPGTPVWNPQEPNSYADFGPTVTTVSRNPINDSRQRQKGVVTDVDASGGFNSDLTTSNFQELSQGVLFADLRRKEEAADIDNVDATGDTFDKTGAFGSVVVNDLVFAANFADAANNGLHLVSSATANDIGVTSALVDEAAPATDTSIVVVGHQFAAGDIDVDATGTLPALTSTVADFTTFGLVPGEWVFIGGDTASLKFANAENNGFARIRTIAANRLTFDKTDSTMVTEASTTETVRIFFGRVIKNESDPTLIKCRSYQLERTLGASNPAQPSQIQSEYIIGAVPNETTLNFSSADKITVDYGFVGTDAEYRTGVVGVKSGTRPALTVADALNSTSDFSRIRMALVSDTDAAPTPLFAFVQDYTLTINNNIAPNKAIGTLGAISLNAGQFNVEGSLTAYFADVTAVTAVRNNSSVTLDFALVKANAGLVFDVPLITLGDGKLNVTQGEAITVPVDIPAAADPNFDHTLLGVFFDYLPNLADPS